MSALGGRFPVGNAASGLVAHARAGTVKWRCAAVFAAAGLMKLAAIEFEVRGFAHFGYAPWFMYAIGVLELGAGLALLFRRSAAPAALLLGVAASARALARRLP